ncbi:type II toxin-antitoxin system RelE/ParE family toxin [candidate division KSB1 bacterium]|nr:type II toxin-antitoxin system RelE/ParE family toxin [candidate division KSB1 bacterium]
MPIIYKIHLARNAERDIEYIFAYLMRERPSAAAKFIYKLEASPARLNYNPARFPKIRERTTRRHTYRRFLFLSYRLVYRIHRNKVLLLRVFHQAQLLRDLE